MTDQLKSLHLYQQHFKYFLLLCSLSVLDIDTFCYSFVLCFIVNYTCSCQAAQKRRPTLSYAILFNVKTIKCQSFKACHILHCLWQRVLFLIYEENHMHSFNFHEKFQPKRRHFQWRSINISLPPVNEILQYQLHNSLSCFHKPLFCCLIFNTFLFRSCDLVWCFVNILETNNFVACVMSNGYPTMLFHFQ